MESYLLLLHGTRLTTNMSPEEIQAINNSSPIPGMWVLDSSTVLPGNAEGIGLTVDQTSPSSVRVYDTLAPFGISGASGTASNLYSLTDTLNLTSATPVSGAILPAATSAR